MTNEQLLEQLKQLSNIMAGDKEELKKSKVIIEKQISELELKLRDDTNYPSPISLFCEVTIRDIERNIEKLISQQKRNETTIFDDSNEAKRIDVEIENCNELISQCEQRIDEIGKELKDLTEKPDKKLEKELSKELKTKREALNGLRQKLSTYTSERESLVDQINSITERNKQIPLTIEKYQQVKADLEIQKDESQFDKASKTLDKVILASLKDNLKDIDSRIEFEEITILEEVNALIMDIESGSISQEEIISRVQKIKSKLPKTKSNPEEIDSDLEYNKNKKIRISTEIEELQTKLNDSVNYTPSSMSLETNESISNMELRIAEYDSSIKFSEYLIAEYTKAIPRNEQAIALEEKKIEELQIKNDDIKFRMSNLDLTQKEQDDLSKQFNRNKKEIDNSRKQIDRLIKNISTIETLISTTKKDKKEMENMKISDTKVLNSAKESLEDRKTIDKLLMLNDETELAILKVKLTALKAKEEILSMTKLGNSLADYKPQTSELENSNLDSEEVVSSFSIENDNENLTDDNQELDLPVESEVIEENESEKLLVAVIGFKDSTPELIEKSKDLNFVNGVKGKLVMNSLILTVGAAASLTSSNEDVVKRESEVIEESDEVLDEEVAVTDISETVEETEMTDEEQVIAPIATETEEFIEPAIPDSLDEEVNTEYESVVSNPGEFVISQEDVSETVDNSDVENSTYSVDYGYDSEDGYEAPVTQEIGESWEEYDTPTVEVNVSEDIEEPTVEKEDKTEPKEEVIQNYDSNLSPEEQAFLDAVLQEQLALEQETIKQGKSI